MFQSGLRYGKLVLTVAGVLLFLLSTNAGAMIDGISGNTFALSARADHISTPDGGVIYIWGYANGAASRAQYPGPTLIVTEGDTVTIQLTNELPASAGKVSMVFPGHQATAAGGSPGPLTRESGGPSDVVTYQFKATHPGTYTYFSGTRQELQIEMGLFGVIIVRPLMGATYAYNDADTMFDHEFLFLLSEIDPGIHQLVELGLPSLVDNTKRWPVYWFINGRAAPDTMREAFTSELPTQPYNCMPMMHPGHRMLMRVANAGRDLHPFHHHGNHAKVIAKDGRLLSSGPGVKPDLAEFVFTVQSVPGETVDAIFEWTGKGLGWDVYGCEQDIDNAPLGNFPGSEDIDHNKNGVFDSVALQPHEYEPDHGKPFPVFLPNKLDLTFGAHYSGSPFLGVKGVLPPGQGLFNPTGGLYFMWHSHTEKEMVNYDIFPGGMMTMMVIEPPGIVHMP